MLLRGIQEIAREPVLLAPEDQPAEFVNTRWFDVTSEERLSLSVDQLISAFEQTARALRRQVGEMAFRGVATFYVWHDEQAGQLRCSVCSRSRADLPFGGSYYPTDDLRVIVTHFLSDDEPGVVSWDELESVDGVDADDVSAPLFPVWTFDLSAAG